MNDDISIEQITPPKTYAKLQVLKVVMPERRRHFLDDDYQPHDSEPPGIHFTQPVPDFYVAKHIPLIVLLSSTPATVSHLGIGFRGDSAGTGLTQLRVAKIFRLPRGVRISSIIEAISKTYRKRVSDSFESHSLVPTKSSAAAVDAILSLCPQAQPFIEQAITQYNHVSYTDSSDAALVLQEHHDGVLTAFAFAGMDRAFIKNAIDEGRAESGWFLEAIDAARVREDPMIIHDAGIVPGMNISNAHIHGKRFSDGIVNLTVLLINRQPLEELTGADLIYYNETFKTFILIQYKALEKEGSADVFRLPNENLAKEIRRMEVMTEKLARCVDIAAEPKGYRIASDPFFLKFCPRAAHAAAAADLFKGFYIPLDYFKSLEASKELDGPRGGKLLSYDNVQRWFTNSEFIPLVKRGWIGTTPAQSDMLQMVVEHTLESGRAATFAVVEKAS